MAGAVDEGEVNLLHVQFAEVLFDVVEGDHRIRRTVGGIAEPWRRQKEEEEEEEDGGGRRRRKTEEAEEGGRGGGRRRRKQKETEFNEEGWKETY